MTTCPSCASTLVQALRWEDRTDGARDVALRCPECESCFRARLSPAATRELEEGQAAARREILAAYERVVAESMEALAACLAAAFERDLLGADDFAGPTSRPAAP